MPFEVVPSLVIGLGGTGLKAVTLVKKALLEANKNTVPDTVALIVSDAEDAPTYAAGGWGRGRLEGDSTHQTGPVTIDTYGEYAGLTGDLKQLGGFIAAEQKAGRDNPAIRRSQTNRHLNSWFQADYYLNEANVSSDTWSLTIGAGQYRQMARLGLFSRLKSVIIPSLGGSLDGLRQKNARRVSVHIVASLAGGTGAALFADFAHLVKKMADEKLGENSASVFGHFVMGDAFLGTEKLDLQRPEKLATFRARSFAALRELIRLQGATPEVPYPIAYDPVGTGLNNSRIDAKLYDAVWLYDGNRSKNTLLQREIQSGVAPTIAEAIMAFLDRDSNHAFGAYSINLPNTYNSYGLSPKQVTFSSLGTYTIELPIYHIVEGWSHTLAREVLDALLGPMKSEEKTDHPIELRLENASKDGSRTQDSYESPADRAKRFLTEQTTLLVNRLADYGRQAARSPELRRQKVSEVVALDAETWKQLLAPGDPAFQDLVSQAHDDLVGSLKVSGSYFVDYGKFGGSAEQKAVNLQAAADGALGRMLGEIEDVWRRTGGNVGASLEKLAVLHLREYTASLQKWMSEHLNGTNSSGDALEKKSGKLGYVTAVLQSLADAFKEAQSVVLDADATARTQRRPVFDGLDADRKQVFERMRESSGIVNLNLRNYRDKSDELAQFQKADIARRLVVKLVKNLQSRTVVALAEVQRWAKILATGRVTEGGAYAVVLEGQREVEQDRTALTNPTRWVIRDDEPGDKYITGMREKRSGSNDETAIKDILKVVKWDLSQSDEGEIGVALLVNGEALDKRAGEADSEGRGESRGRANAAILLKRCRQTFVDAWEGMSVVDYLVHNYADDEAKLFKLAERVVNASGTLLSLNVDGPRQKITFMRTYHPADARADIVLRKLYEGVSRLSGSLTSAELRQKAGERGNAIEGPSETGEPSQDKFKLAFIMFADLIKPEEVRTFVDGQRAYRDASRHEQWRTMHVFPAETNALSRERELSSFNPPQRRREMAVDVVKLLEDENLFRLAMRCMAYGETDFSWATDSGTPLEGRGLLLHKYQNPDRIANPNGWSSWRLMLRPMGDAKGLDTMGGLAMPVAFDLTEQAEEPDLLEAFMKLTVAKTARDMRTVINPSRVEDTLALAMRRHSELCWQRSPRGWTLENRIVGDSGLEREAMDRAAELIRLTALIKRCDRQLASEKWLWAWEASGTGNPSGAFSDGTALTEAQSYQIQRQVDLWTMMRSFAASDLISLKARFSALGQFDGVTPPDVDIPPALPRPRTGDVAGRVPSSTPRSPEPGIAPSTGDEAKSTYAAFLGLSVAPPMKPGEDAVGRIEPGELDRPVAKPESYTSAPRENLDQNQLTEQKYNALKFRYEELIELGDSDAAKKLADLNERWRIQNQRIPRLTEEEYRIRKESLLKLPDKSFAKTKLDALELLWSAASGRTAQRDKEYQEKIDALSAARDVGAITNEEFGQQKQALDAEYGQ